MQKQDRKSFCNDASGNILVFDANCAMVSCISMASISSIKQVILHWSVHKTEELQTSVNYKIVRYCNNTKTLVWINMCYSYVCIRNSKWRPLAIFCRMVNEGSIDFSILHEGNTDMSGKIMSNSLKTDRHISDQISDWKKYLERASATLAHPDHGYTERF